MGTSRILPAAAALGAGLLVLAGCGGSSTDGSGGGGDGEVTLTFANADPAETWATAIEGFEEQHPDITVKQLNIPYAQYTSTINQRMGAGGDGIDLMVVDAGGAVLDWNNRGYLADLSALRDDAVAAAVSESMVTAREVDGKLLAIAPWTTSQFLYYNTDVLAAAGVEPPSGDPALAVDVRAADRGGADGAERRRGGVPAAVRPVGHLLPAADDGRLRGRRRRHRRRRGRGLLRRRLAARADLVSRPVRGRALAAWHHQRQERRAVPGGQGRFHHLRSVGRERGERRRDQLRRRACALLRGRRAGDVHGLVGGGHLVEVGEPRSRRGVPALPDHRRGRQRPGGRGGRHHATNKEAFAAYVDGVEASAGAATAGFGAILQYQLENNAVHRPAVVGYSVFEPGAGQLFSDIRNGSDPAERAAQADEEISAQIERLR